MTSNIIARAGYQSLDHTKQSIDPDVFKLFMQQPNSGVALSFFGDKKPEYIDVNTKKINSKEEYANVLRRQIEEKETLRRLQDSPGRNYNKVTNYNPTVVEQALVLEKQKNLLAQHSYNPYQHKPQYQQNRSVSFQNEPLPSLSNNQQTYQPISQPLQPFLTPLQYQQQQPILKPNQKSPQREQIQNDSNVSQQQPKNTRGLFFKELYQTQQQQALKEQVSDQYKNELLQQMEEKRQKKQAEKEREEQEDLRYMEKFNRQVVELQDLDQTNDRKISKLHAPHDPPEKPNKIAYPPSVILPPALTQQEDNSQFEDLRDRLNQITTKQNSYITEAQMNQIQNKVDFDMMKEYYQYQQIMFDRDLVKLREQLTRADQTRINAERELLFLQDRAREKRIWDVFNYENSDTLMRSYLPQEKSIFRTAKYTIGHQSESEKRQNILRDYYKGERAGLALGPLGVVQENENLDRELPELETQSKPLVIKQNQIKFELDPQLEGQIRNIKKRENLPENPLPIEHFNQEDFERLLQENSQVQILKNLDIKAITAYEKKFIADEVQIPQKSDGFKTEVDENLKKEIEDRIRQGQEEEQEEDVQQSEQSSQYDFPIAHQKTEELFLQQEKEKQDQDNYQLDIDWQQEVEEDKDEPDVLDKQIGEALNDIKGLVNQKGIKQDYYSVQTELKFTEMKNSSLLLKDKEYEEKRLKLKDWKEITLFKKKPTPQVQKIIEQDQTADPLDRLDDLLKQYNK